MNSKPVILLCIIGIRAISFGAASQEKQDPQPDGDCENRKPDTEKPPPAASAEVRAILNRLERAGKTYESLKADLVYTVISPLTGDTRTRTGWVAFQNPTGETSGSSSARFRISFKTLKLGNKPATDNRIDYLFDGRWLTIAKHTIKSMTRIQVAAKGEKIDALKIGEGPFPVPFGQKADNVIRMFETISRKTEKGDPEHTDYLKLVPRREHKEEINFTRLEMWIDRENNLPVRIHSTDHNKNRTKVTFDDIKTDAEIDAGIFTMKKPAGWDLTIERNKGTVIEGSELP